jgi:RNA-directed DNA polymerase
MLYAYLHICLSKKIAPEWIVEGDIKACFDEINHNWILDNIPMDKQILKEFLKAGYIENYHRACFKIIYHLILDYIGD